MFSKGQLFFALFFIIIFAGVLVWCYRKDFKLHKLHYKNTSIVVLLALIAMITLFTVITFSLH
jgi:hypothetical protein